MAIALRQITGDGKSTNSANHSVTYASAPLENSLLLAGLSHRNTSTCSDITLSGWTEIGCNGNGYVTKAFYKIAGAGESSTVTINTNSVSAAGGMIIAEYTGIDTTTPLDIAGTPTLTVIDVTSLLSDSITTTAADTLLISFEGVRAGGADGSFSYDSSFTVRDDREGTGASPSSLGFGDRIVSSTGSYSTTASWTTAGRGVNIIAAFKAAAVGGISIPVVMNHLRNQGIS